MGRYRQVRMIKSFRGLLADGGQDTINLHTNDGKTGYRIVKFQVINYAPGVNTIEGTMKIYSLQQTAVDALVDFNEPTLLGAAYYVDANSTANTQTQHVIFDQVIFNQDIFITYVDTDNSNPLNYYIELEQMPLDLNESTVATLQSIRNV